MFYTCVNKRIRSNKRISLTTLSNKRMHLLSRVYGIMVILMEYLPI